LETGAYPDAAWSDFPVILLNWWIDAYLELAISDIDEVKWSFMDGPYGVILSKNVGGDSSLGFDYENLKNDLLDVADKVIAHCCGHRMLTPDLSALRVNAAKLRASQTAGRITVFVCRESGRQ
jgi:hypothetical protein